MLRHKVWTACHHHMQSILAGLLNRSARLRVSHCAPSLPTCQSVTRSAAAHQAGAARVISSLRSSCHRCHPCVAICTTGCWVSGHHRAFSSACTPCLQVKALMNERSPATPAAPASTITTKLCTLHTLRDSDFTQEAPAVGLFPRKRQPATHGCS